MKELTFKIVVTSLVVISLISPVRAEIVTMGEALNVANNWITVLLQKKGTWGDANTAHVQEVRVFKRDGRILGYFCPVWPKGYIIVSLRKELAPVKACSVTSDLDPASEEGMTDFIKDCMERILNTIEKKVGPLSSARTEDVSRILEINYRTAWTELERDEDEFEKGLGSGVIAMDYQEGEVLLETRWSQGDPYNRDCPAPPSGDDCDQPRCVVGCVATAAAQIMRYWCWPPFGVGTPYNDLYDWVNMPEDIIETSPAAQINAVAELCHEIGVAVDMDYCGGEGCKSSVPTADIEAVYEGPYRYSDYCCRLDRDDYTADQWFGEIAQQINCNQPIQYRVPGHSIVADGWRVLGARQYHMNYGWDNAYTTWYTLDALHLGDYDEEYMMVNIFPVTSVRHAIAGIYPREDFNFRYFNQNASGSSAVFEPDQLLQFLPDIVVTSTGSIKFGASSWFFTRGDASRGIRTDSGGIRLYSGGQMKLY